MLQKGLSLLPRSTQSLERQAENKGEMIQLLGLPTEQA